MLASTLRSTAFSTLAALFGGAALALVGCPAAPEHLAPTTTPRDQYVDDLSGRIVASVLSLPPGLIDPAEASALTAALSRARPERRLVVLTREDLSPWPRDPFLFFWRGPGPLRPLHPLLLARPNRQPEREGDIEMAYEAERQWPPDLSRPRVETSSLPFHAGQLLTDPERVWLSLHSLETDVVGRLGLGGVPARDFANAEGIAPYLGAARAAAEDIGSLLGRRPAWVHPVEADPGLFAVLGAGAGLDLDSYLTFLPGDRAFVGSISASREALAAASPADLESLRTFYELRLPARALGEALRAANSDSRAVELDRYLDSIARHLAAQGLAIERIPLVRVTTDLFEDRDGVDYAEFFLSWNNVVIENRAGPRSAGPRAAGPRAEGFDLRFPSVDAAVAERFRAAGVPFTALPPLRRSIVLGGGYRCASNHLRKL